MRYKHLILKMVLAMSNETIYFRFTTIFLQSTVEKNTRKGMRKHRNAKPRLSALCPNWKALILSKVHTALLWVCCR